MLLERAYAKVNLTLDVNGQRGDGYHDIDMVMQTVDLSDTLWIEDMPGSTTLAVEASATSVPSGEKNLAYIAADVFRTATGLTRGVKIRIDKYIPVAAGLGGGSADAAAVLRGLNRLWRVGLTLEELAAIGARIGSDVPFLVHEGCAVATGRGECLRLVSHPTKAWAVLIRPNLFVSTATVYQAVESYVVRQSPSSTAMVRNLQAGNLDAVIAGVSNDLLAVAEALYPEIAELRRRVEMVVKTPVFMSGSGPTLFCLAPNQVVAQRYYNAVRGFNKEVYIVRFRPRESKATDCAGDGQPVSNWE